jgi:hypothetical protein
LSIPDRRRIVLRLFERRSQVFQGVNVHLAQLARLAKIQSS